MTSSQASMHRPQPMQPSWRPPADVDPGRADGDALAAVDAVAAALPAGAPLVRPARLAAPVAVGHQQAVAVEQAALDARPRAHLGADLLARPAGQQVGRGREQADEEVDGALAPPVKMSRSTVGASLK
jgi:hypothetical protein